jgi:hypothetical protein
MKHTNGPLPPVGPKNQCNSSHGDREDVFFEREQARKGSQVLLLENDHNQKNYSFGMPSITGGIGEIARLPKCLTLFCAVSPHGLRLTAFFAV